MAGRHVATVEIVPGGLHVAPPERRQAPEPLGRREIVGPQSGRGKAPCKLRRVPRGVVGEQAQLRILPGLDPIGRKPLTGREAPHQPGEPGGPPVAHHLRSMTRIGQRSAIS